MSVELRKFALEMALRVGHGDPLKEADRFYRFLADDPSLSQDNQETANVGLRSEQVNQKASEGGRA